MRKKKTTEEFKQEVFSLVKDEYEVLGEYINANTHITIKHSECGHIYLVTPSKFVSTGRRCPNCNGSKKKTTEEFKQEVYSLVKDEYDVLDEYINSKTKIKIKHNKCGHIYSVSPSNFLKGNRCPQCSGNKRKNTEEFKNEVYDLVKNEYEVLGEYINSKEHIEMKHNKCGHIYNVSPSSFLKGSRCPKCFGTLKKTNKEFKKEVYDKVGNEYEFLEDYINTDTLINVKHNYCGHIYKVSPAKFLNKGTRCPKCADKLRGEKRRGSTEKFKEEVYNKVGDEYTVLGEYTLNNEDILVRHNKCGYEYLVRPSNFKNGNRCPKCSNKIPVTTEIFKSKVFNLVENEYEVLGEYVNNSTHIKMRHTVCGNEYNVKPSNFLSGNRCPKCFGTPKKTTEQFKEEVYNLYKEEYSVVGEYKTCKDKVSIRHNKCGYIWDVAPGTIVKGTLSCINCSKRPLVDTNIFKNRIKDIYGDEYEVLDEYKNAVTKIKVKHNYCSHIYSVLPGNILQGKGCPKCKSSKGEKYIMDLLNRYNIVFIHNKAYGNCKHESSLIFDFLIFDKNQNLKLICEFDGIQHFEPIEIFGGKEAFKETQIRDSIKNKFCKENKIPLLRIPYWEIDNIHKILCKKLYKLGLISNETV